MTKRGDSSRMMPLLKDIEVSGYKSLASAKGQHHLPPSGLSSDFNATKLKMLEEKDRFNSDDDNSFVDLSRADITMNKSAI